VASGVMIRMVSISETATVAPQSLSSSVMA
jgi:hypothetical protein